MVAFGGMRALRAVPRTTSPPFPRADNRRSISHEAAQFDRIGRRRSSGPLAARAQRPAMPVIGCLSAGSLNRPDVFRRAATYVGKVLQGAQPSALPVEQPTKFDFVINLRTAKALGIAIPQSLLLIADEVIE
jgi:hypothetical protein